MVLIDVSPKAPFGTRMSAQARSITRMVRFFFSNFLIFRPMLSNKRTISLPPSAFVPNFLLQRKPPSLHPGYQTTLLRSAHATGSTQIQSIPHRACSILSNAAVFHWFILIQLLIPWCKELFPGAQYLRLRCDHAGISSILTMYVRRSKPRMSS